jgi:hypothetical protein
MAANWRTGSGAFFASIGWPPRRASSENPRAGGRGRGRIPGLDETPAARLIAQGTERHLRLEEVEALLSSRSLIVDAWRFCVREAGTAIEHARRPVLFTLARLLAEACTMKPISRALKSLAGAGRGQALGGGRVPATIPAPGGGADSGLAWHEGTLWLGQYRDRKIYQIDRQTGEVLRTIESKRFVTGVTWVDGELWHGTWEGDNSDLRHVDPQTGAVLQTIEMPPGVAVSGLESDGAGQFFCGGGRSGKIRAVRRPKR